MCENKDAAFALHMAAHLLNSRSTAGKILVPENSWVSILAAKMFIRVGRLSTASAMRILVDAGVRPGTGGAKSEAKHVRCMPFLQRPHHGSTYSADHHPPSVHPIL